MVNEMFGYITVNKDELKIKDYKKYGSYYCGVCRSLGNSYGISGRMTLSYDMAFLALLLSSLYEDRTPVKKYRCVPHPLQSHDTITNKYTDYAAAMNVMLTYYKLLDDWDDEHNVKSRVMSKTLEKAYRKAARRYPRQEKAIRRYIKDQRICEIKNTESLDEAAGHTGIMLAEIFDMKHDIWKGDLRRMGFFLGKFIYVMDAFDDVYRDIKSGSYNPLKKIAHDKDFNGRCRNILTMYAAGFARPFENLPVLDNADILRNIIYSGVWTRFNDICDKRKSKAETEKKH